MLTRLQRTWKRNRSVMVQMPTGTGKTHLMAAVIRSLTPNPSRGEGDFEPSLVVIDEAHHALAKTYRVLWDKWPKAKFLGLTATPCRLNNAPFTDLFQKLLQSWSIQEFIDRGWLSDFEYVSASPDSMALRQIRSLKKRGTDGDYQSKELATVMDVPESLVTKKRDLAATDVEWRCNSTSVIG